MTEALESARAHYKSVYDKYHRKVKFQLGNQVLIETKNIQIPQYLSRKWKHCWHGPYLIVQVVHEDVYCLDLGPLLEIHPFFHVSKLKKFHENECQLDDTQTVLCLANTKDVGYAARHRLWHS